MFVLLSNPLFCSPEKLSHPVASDRFREMFPFFPFLSLPFPSLPFPSFPGYQAGTRYPTTTRPVPDQYPTSTRWRVLGGHFRGSLLR